MRLLGDPQDHLRIVHVAGSKGKGSTAAMLAAVLARAGYRTGLFTSPHLCRVEERIQVEGRPITPDELSVLIGDIRAALASSRAVWSRPSSRLPRPWDFCTSGGVASRPRLSRWGSAVASIRPTSAGRRWRSSPTSASITSSNSGIPWPVSPRRRRASSSRADPPSAGPQRPEARARHRAASPRSARAPAPSSALDFRYDYVSGRVTAEATRVAPGARAVWPIVPARLDAAGPARRASGR